MHTYISPDNSKGVGASVSLRPVLDCAGACAACRKSCYALKAWRQYEAVRQTQTINSFLAHQHRDEYFADIDGYILKKRPRRFRWHVAGDCLDLDYLHRVYDLCSWHPQTKFLIFTKRADLLNASNRTRPRNLQLFFSVWMDGDLDLPANMPHGVRYAVTVPKGELVSSTATVCPGSCASCDYCFEPGGNVVFEQH